MPRPVVSDPLIGITAQVRSSKRDRLVELAAMRDISIKTIIREAIDMWLMANDAQWYQKRQAEFVAEQKAQRNKASA